MPLWQLRSHFHRPKQAQSSSAPPRPAPQRRLALWGAFSGLTPCCECSYCKSLQRAHTCGHQLFRHPACLSLSTCKQSSEANENVHKAPFAPAALQLRVLRQHDEPPPTVESSVLLISSGHSVTGKNVGTHKDSSLSQSRSAVTTCRWRPALSASGLQGQARGRGQATVTAQPGMAKASGRRNHVPCAPPLTQLLCHRLLHALPHDAKNVLRHVQHLHQRLLPAHTRRLGGLQGDSPQPRGSANWNHQSWH